MGLLLGAERVPEISRPFRSTHQQYPVLPWHCMGSLCGQISDHARDHVSKLGGGSDPIHPYTPQAGVCLPVMEENVVFKAKSKYAPELLRYRLPLYLLFLFISLVFLVVNLVCALLVRMSSAEAHTIVLVRVAINDTLFVLCAVSLSLCLYKIAKLSLANIYLESKGTSVCQVTVIGAIVILLYASRACYNLVVLGLSNKSINSFDYDWYNVSDQADLQLTLGDVGYIVFGVVLFVWELLPTSLVVFFFRVRKPNLDRSGSGLPGHVFSSRAYFFDNPRRYDSDDNLAWSVMPQNIQASLAADSYEWGSQNSGIGVYIGSDDSYSCPPPPPEELSHY